MNETQKEVIKKLTELWEEQPDLRFFQLIKCIEGNENTFYTKDEDALKLIVKTSYWLGLHD